MKRLTLFATFWLLHHCIFAQDLHIYYDLQTQTPRYVVDSQEVLRPYVRRGANVILHVENYNNYLYDVVVQQENREIRLPANASPSSLSALFPALGQNSAGLFSLTGGSNVAGLNTGSGSQDRGSGPTSFDAALGISRTQFQQLTQTVENFNKSLVKLQTISTSVNDKRKDVQALVESHQVNAFILQEIENIKYDPALKPDQIKRMTKDYMCKALNISNEGDIKLNLDSLLKKGNTRAQLVAVLEDVKEKHDDYREEKARLNALKESLAEDFPDNLLISSQYVQPAVQSYDQISQEESDIESLENKILQLVTQIPDVDVLKLAALWREYEALQGNSFTKNYRALAEGDNLVFDIRLVPNDSGIANKAPTLQLAPLQVPVASSFKVNASIGLAFGQVFDRPKTYFVQDNTIRAEDQDSFLPFVASFFHFYGQSKGTVSLGGNFGIGLPITGDSAQSASFFLGPSLIIGRSDRLVINTGLMGTRVQRLAQGLTEGSVFLSSVNNVPTKNVYEMGYFLGLSFNVLGGNR
ncbi:MAG: hypothetical protein ACK4TA_11905 [Saprospiraceae bacterium]